MQYLVLLIQNEIESILRIKVKVKKGMITVLVIY
jgi:hypothetical protein